MPFAVEITTTRFSMVPFYYRSIVGPESRRLRNGSRLACEEGIRAYGRDIAGFLFPSLSPSCQIPSRNNSRFASFRCSS
jgi:hypothetical protein